MGATPPPGGRYSPSLTSSPPCHFLTPHSPVNAQRQDGHRESVGEGTRTLRLPRPWRSASHTRGAGLRWKAPVPWPYVPFRAREARTPTEQRHPTPPPRPRAFPPPMSREQANSEAAPASSRALPEAPRQASVARPVPWGSQARSSRGMRIRPDLAESTHHDVCARSRGGSPPR